MNTEHNLHRKIHFFFVKLYFNSKFEIINILGIFLKPSNKKPNKNADKNI